MVYTWNMSFESTGGTVERELFDRPKGMAAETPKYLNRREAFRFVREHQPEGSDPHDPKQDFAASVMAEVEKILGVSGKDQILFYTAVGSSLDRYQGIDGWYEYKGTIVTIDLTANPHKDSHKADIVFLVPHDGLDRLVDAEQFESYTKELAMRIADYFINATTRTAREH